MFDSLELVLVLVMVWNDLAPHALEMVLDICLCDDDLEVKIMAFRIPCVDDGHRL